MLRKASPEIKKLFKEFNIDRERFLQALSQVRGNQKVTTDNPEAVTERFCLSMERFGGAGKGSEIRPGNWTR